MMIEVNYVHFHNLNRNVLDLGKQVRELAEDKARYREMCDELDARCNELKAEVERLTPLLGDIVSFDEYHKLLQQVERLTKAGDAMALEIINAETTASVWLPKVVLEWNAAMEGKQP